MTIYLDELGELYESKLISYSKMAVSILGKIAVGVTFLYVGPTNSISALFVCENHDGLKNLEHLYVIGELQSMLEERFTSLLRTDDPHVMVHIKNIVWELSDYQRCSVYFDTLSHREFLQVIILLLVHLVSYLGLLHIYVFHPDSNNTCKLVLITNRKSHISFRLLPKSVTMNGVMTVILLYFAKFGTLWGRLRQSG